jgi:hypothetical protein
MCDKEGTTSTSSAHRYKWPSKVQLNSSSGRAAGGQPAYVDPKDRPGHCQPSNERPDEIHLRGKGSQAFLLEICCATVTSSLTELCDNF